VKSVAQSTLLAYICPANRRDFTQQLDAVRTLKKFLRTD
jgi:hypothetical protein